MSLMNRYAGEVFVVRREGVVVAEPTGGVERRAADAPAQTWFAAVDAETAVLDGIQSGRVSAEIELTNPVPDWGPIGRVVRLSRTAGNAVPSKSIVPDRRDDAMDLLELVPDDWQPYEVRFGELDGQRWEAFVGTLFPVSIEEIDAVLGAGWEQLIRIEPWLLPTKPLGPIER